MKFIITKPICDGKGGLDAAALEEFGQKAFEVLRSVITDKPNAVIGLATGSTPLPLYRKMTEDHSVNGTVYDAITTFNLDEYVGLGEGDEQSYIYFMKKNLFDAIGIPMRNVNIPDGKAADVEEECRRYHKLLCETAVDLQVLGLGANGHIAFNEPHTPFDSITHVTPLTEKTISDNARFFASECDVPRYALTMGLGEIMRAKKILLLAYGKNKAEALRAMAKGAIDTSCPASILRRHNDVICVVDEDAYSLM